MNKLIGRNFKELVAQVEGEFFFLPTPDFSLAKKDAEQEKINQETELQIQTKFARRNTDKTVEDAKARYLKRKGQSK